MRPIPDALARLYPPRNPTAIHTRPWWVASPGPFLSTTKAYVRADGWALPGTGTVCEDGRIVWLANEGDPAVNHAMLGEHRMLLIEAADAIKAMEQLDLDFPLPCPPRRCGQVWAQDGIGGPRRVVVTAEAGENAVWFNGRLYSAWPPPNAVLLHDPFGHPWAPVE